MSHGLYEWHTNVSPDMHQAMHDGTISVLPDMALSLARLDNILSNHAMLFIILHSVTHHHAHQVYLG